MWSALRYISLPIKRLLFGQEQIQTRKRIFLCLTAARSDLGRMICKMSLSIALLFTALVCVVNCSISAKTVIKEVFREFDFKRQATDSDQCVSDAIERASVEDICMISTSEADAAGDDQASINEIYRAFCRPACMNIILGIQEECEVFDDFPGLREFVTGLCEVNDDNQPCYVYFSRAISFISDVEIDCYVDQLLDSSSCNCQSQLRAEVNAQGCCINIYHDYLRAVFQNSTISYNPQTVYNNCNVALPEECSSMALVSTIAITVTAFIFQALFAY